MALLFAKLLLHALQRLTETKQWRCPAKPWSFIILATHMLKQHNSHLGIHFKTSWTKTNFSGLSFFLSFLFLLILCVFIVKINKCMKCRKEIMGKGLLQGVPPQITDLSQKCGLQIVIKIINFKTLPYSSTLRPHLQNLTGPFDTKANFIMLVLSSAV